jgi:hypothetical protein
VPVNPPGTPFPVIVFIFKGAGPFGSDILGTAGSGGACGTGNDGDGNVNAIVLS